MISKDGDFANKTSDELHEHLLDDLTSYGLAPDRVRLVHSLDDYLKEYVDSSTQALESTRRLLDEDTSWASELRETLRQALLSIDISRDPVMISTSLMRRPISNMSISNCRRPGDHQRL